MKTIIGAVALLALLGACAQTSDERPAAPKAIAAEAPALAPADASALIQKAFFYTLPIHEMGMIRLKVLGDGVAPGTSSLNQWTHNRALLSADFQPVTGPNNDTLYSSAWIDLANGPVKVSTPDTAGRYFSVSVFDAYTNAIDVLGRRKSGTRAAEYVIVGPHWTGALPDGMQVIRATTDDIFLLVRVLVDGEADIKTVAALQEQFSLTPVTPGKAPRPIWARALTGSDSGAEHYVDLVNEMIARDPPPTYESTLLAQLAPIGICGAACGWSKLSPDTQRIWSAALPKLYQGLKSVVQNSKPQPTGWTINRRWLGDFGTDYLYRAAVALVGILALPPAEAIYSHGRFDGEGRRLDGAHKYVLHLPPGGVPADAFWSLSMYQEDADGRHWFIHNPINRFAIGNRTPGLTLNKDGSLDILIQSERPKTGVGNWLPAPQGPFLVSMRAYQPKAEYLDGRFKLPPLQRID